MRTVDLFCGVGGLSLGLSRAGFDIVAGVDFWRPALEVYAYNNPEHDAHHVDISDTDSVLTVVSHYRPYCIVGGPPCQDFSTAGNKKEGDRADLTIAFAKIICKTRLRPQYFIMENVARAANSDAVKTATELFKETGYGLSTHILDASLCGVPQKRKRMFIVGAMNTPDNFLTPFVDAKLAKKPMTVRDYFGDNCNFDNYYRHPRNYNRRSVFSADEPSPTIRGVNRPVPKGHKKHTGDTTDASKVSALTTAQRAMIQTFPADYKWHGSRTAQEQMIGNAVPVNLGQFIGQAVMDYMHARYIECAA